MFARAWKAMPAFAGQRRFYPWLTVIAANLCADIHRKSDRMTPLGQEDLQALAPAVGGNGDLVLEQAVERDLLSRRR